MKCYVKIEGGRITITVWYPGEKPIIWSCPIDRPELVELTLKSIYDRGFSDGEDAQMSDPVLGKETE